MRNADLNDLKDEQYRERVGQERKDVDAIPKTQTTKSYVEDCKYLAALIHNKWATNNGSYSKFWGEYLPELLEEFAKKVDVAARNRLKGGVIYVKTKL